MSTNANSEPPASDIKPRMRKCSATTKTGRPCQAWSIRNLHPPLCSVHAGRNTGAGAPHDNDNARTHGFYSTNFSLAEVTALLSHANTDNLLDEIALARILTDRLHNYLTTNDLNPSQFMTAIQLLLDATGRIAVLMRTQSTLSSDSTDTFTMALTKALDELSSRLDIPL